MKVLRERRKSRWKAITFIPAVVGILVITVSVFHTTRKGSIPAEHATSKYPPSTSQDFLFVSKPRVPSQSTYPYSVIPGGAHNQGELIAAIHQDDAIKTHYLDFDIAKARVTELQSTRSAYVSYRIGDHVYWTRRKVLLLSGERLLTDGKHLARTRCGNRISDKPQPPTSELEPPPEAFDTPVEVSLADLPRQIPPVVGGPVPVDGPSQQPPMPIIPLVPLIPGGRGDPGPHVSVGLGGDVPPSPVPEPGTITLVAIGAGGLLRFFRKSRSQ